MKSGYQAAMLAPTEILAEQNCRIISRLFPDYEVVFLSGSTKLAEKKAIKAKIKSGEAKIVVGTHAVIQSDVEFYNLSMCVCIVSASGREARSWRKALFPTYS